MTPNDWDRASTWRLGCQAVQEYRERLKAPDRDLVRKDKALAQAAALLVLRNLLRRAAEAIGSAKPPAAGRRSGG